MSRRARRVLALLAAVSSVAAGCGDDDDDAAAGASEAVEGDLAVFAAASLAESLTEIGDAFHAANPDASVTLSFAASSALVHQIIGGAPADVFASADTNSMQKLMDAELDAADPEIFATNLLTIIVAAGNPLDITGVADLADPDVKTVVCTAEAPCGNYAHQIFAAAGVTVTPVSFEQSVRGVSTKVITGEADAGIVYETDVIAADAAAHIVEIPRDINVVAEYPVAVVSTSDQQDLAQAFVDFLRGDEGQAILASYGFGPP